MHISTDYLRTAFDPEQRQYNLDRARHKLRDLHFDTIVVRGVSGLVFGSMLALAMQKGVTVVRKPGESTHSNYGVEGLIPDTHLDRWLIVDDFISTGSTMRAIVERMDFAPGLVGIYLFAHDRLCLFPFDMDPDTEELVCGHILEPIWERYILKNGRENRGLCHNPDWSYEI